MSGFDTKGCGRRLASVGHAPVAGIGQPATAAAAPRGTGVSAHSGCPSARACGARVGVREAGSICPSQQVHWLRSSGARPAEMRGVLLEGQLRNVSSGRAMPRARRMSNGPK